MDFFNPRGKKHDMPKLGEAVNNLPPKASGPIAALLKSLGFDPAEVIGMAQKMLGELERHNALLAEMNLRLAAMENALRLTVPEFNAAMVDRDMAILAAERADG